MRGLAIGLLFAIGIVACDDCETKGSGPSSTCCKVCKDSKPCGDSCIAINQTCQVGPGCACAGFTDSVVEAFE